MVRRDFIALSDSELQHAAQRLMSLAGVRHLPVLHGRELVGVLSLRHLLETSLAQRDAALPEAQLAQLRSRPIESLVEREPVYVTPDCSPAHAARLMLAHRIGFLPVVEGGRDGLRMVGIITERDLLRAAYAPEGGSGG